MGGPRSRVPSQVRAAVKRLMCESDLSMRNIAVTSGLSLTTLCKWNRMEGWRRAPNPPPDWDATLTRLAAIERIARARPGPKPASRGVAPTDMEPAPAAHAAHAAADLPALRAALRDHIGRQIAAFDAALRGEGAAVIDSARVLRDLGGLKRLLDDLGGEGGDDASGLDVDLDLPRLRAEIANRYARRPGERPDDGLPGEPAAAAPPGAGA